MTKNGIKTDKRRRVKSLKCDKKNAKLKNFKLDQFSIKKAKKNHITLCWKVAFYKCYLKRAVEFKSLSNAELFNKQTFDSPILFLSYAVF